MHSNKTQKKQKKMAIAKHVVIYANSSQELQYLLKPLMANIDKEQLNEVLKIEGKKTLSIIKHKDEGNEQIRVLALISIVRKGQAQTAKELKELHSKAITDMSCIKAYSYPQNNKLIQEELSEIIKRHKRIEGKKKAWVFYVYSYYIK